MSKALTKEWARVLVTIFLNVNTVAHAMEKTSKPAGKGEYEGRKVCQKEEKQTIQLTILEAAKKGDTDTIRSLIENGATVVAADIWSWQPIHFAAKGGHLNTVRFLVENGASVNATDNYSRQPIHFATSEGHLDIVRFLVENGASVNVADKAGEQPIHLAASQGHLNTVRFLVENEASVDATDIDGRQAIHFAVRKGQLNTIRFLVENGASVDATDIEGWQPIHFAAKGDQLNTVRFLVENGASVNATDNCSRQPIHLAAREGHLETVKFLVENGGEIDGEPHWDALLEKFSTPSGSSVPPTIDIYNWTVKVTISNLCRITAGQGAQELLKTILDQYGALLEESDIRQALIGAATAGHHAIVELLSDYINRGDLADTLSHALAHAAAQGHIDIVEYIMIQAVNNDDLFVLKMAGKLMRKLLMPFSDIEITADERLLTYNRILRALAEQQRWCCILQPTIGRSRSPVLSQEQAESLVPSHVRNIPEELWWNIINSLSRSNLYDIMS